METLQHEERLERRKQMDFCIIFWYLQISYTGGTWGWWEDVRETRGLSRMEQFVIRRDYDDDTDDDDDDDDTKLTTSEAWYSSNSHRTEQQEIQREAEKCIIKYIRWKKTLYLQRIKNSGTFLKLSSRPTCWRFIKKFWSNYKTALLQPFILGRVKFIHSICKSWVCTSLSLSPLQRLIISCCVAK